MGLQIETVDANAASHNGSPAKVRVGTLDAHMMSGDRVCRNYITTLTTNVLGHRPPLSLDPDPSTDHLFIGTNTVHILATRTPLFHWTEMLYYDVFPKDIGYNSVGATKFATDVVIVDSGTDQRTARWDQPLMEYDVAYGVRDITQLQNLIIFFRTMRGRLYSFLFYDPLDHTSRTQDFIDYTEDQPSDPTDQYVGTGDAVTKVFQLQKTYVSPSGDLTQVRPITKPIDGTVSIALNGTQVYNWTCDKLTGLVTFIPRLTLSALTGMAIVHSSGSNDFQIVSPRPDFANFQLGDKIVMSGWAIGTNNTVESQRLSVTWISPDHKTMTVNTDITTWQAESGRDGVTIYIHPAPHVGDVISAGYSFYVPVRFDTDRLPVTLEEYGVGGAADVKLIEVRPGDL